MIKNQSVIYTITIFLSAYMLFWVQPMAGKALLPVLGGTPSVWNTAMLFFQILLLGGYLYAHLLGKINQVRLQIFIHGAVLICALSLLPMSIKFIAPEDSESPLIWQIITMTGMIGIPFFALSASAPLLQKWFSFTSHPNAHNPYFLYSASNIGSVLALILYPVIVEKYFSLPQQTNGFEYGFIAMIICILLCGIPLFKTIQPPHIAEHDTTRPTIKTIATWLILAFVPSSLMLGLTSFVTTDIGSAPLFWIIPLTLYILSFILAFARKHILSLPFIKLIFIILFLITNIFLNLLLVNYKWEVAIAHGLLFFITALMCHQQLENLKPSAKHLTLFFLTMSIGGALGGVFNALIAPLIFLKPYEYMMASALALFCWGIGNSRKILIPAGFLIMTLHPVIPWEDSSKTLIHISRNYFGTLTVRDDGEMRTLAHGTTAHGSQSTHPEYKTIPLTYFNSGTGIGQLFTLVKSHHTSLNVGGLGMGSGSISCLLRPTDTLTYFEIDPDIIRIANDPNLFTYLKDCKTPFTIIQGDARLKLAQIKDSTYDMTLVDVFSGDNIPMHLITTESVKLYLQKTKPDGLLAIHISNRYMELSREIGLIAQALNIKAYHKIEPAGPIKGTNLSYATTHVVALTNNPVYIKQLEKNGWKILDMTDSQLKPWTDNYANPLRALFTQ